MATRFAEDGLMAWRQGGQTKRVPIHPIVEPAILLIQPKYPHNVGNAVRVASCYGIGHVVMVGRRVPIDGQEHYRLPREERMRGYFDVQLYQLERLPLLAELFPNLQPVAVEMRPNSERLPDFEHRPNSVYVFGPEDGSLGGEVLKQCHRFVVVPTKHCLNLANAVATVLYDRTAKEIK